MNTNTKVRMTAALAALLASGFLTTGCERESDLERAADDFGDAVEDAADELGDSSRDFGDAVEDTAEDMKDAVTDP